MKIQAMGLVPTNKWLFIISFFPNDGLKRLLNPIKFDQIKAHTSKAACLCDAILT